MRRLRYLSYRESYKGGKHEYVFTCSCVSCAQKKEITVLGPDLFQYNQGRVIQEAFPYLNDADRELFISGICGICFDEMFKDE